MSIKKEIATSVTRGCVSYIDRKRFRAPTDRDEWSSFLLFLGPSTGGRSPKFTFMG